MRRRAIIGVAAVVATLLLAGCFSRDDGGAVGSGGGPAAAGLGSRVPRAIRARASLRVGVVAGRAPFAVVPPGGSTPTGADVDLATQVAQSLGLRPVFVIEADSAAAAADLGADKVDLAMAGPSAGPAWPAGAIGVSYLSGDGPLNPLGTPGIVALGGASGIAAAVKAALEVMIADGRYGAILGRAGLTARAVSQVAVAPLNG